jgi:D-threo-aldose 1-dehydrogenase
MTRRLPLGPTGLEVTPICAGLASWQDDRGTPFAQSAELARALFESPDVRYVDTSNNYGDGESERRLGAAIAERGGPGALPGGFVVQTKADRDMTTGDFSGARMRASLEESMERLGLDRLPIVFLHDPENTTWEGAWADDGPVAALVAAREEGVVGHLGISGGPVDMLADYVRSGVFEALISHNRYTLVDRSADALFTLAAERGLGVLNASPYGGGMLTRFPVEPGRYAYGEAAPALVEAANRIGALCRDAGVPLAAAALQWSTRDPRITSTVVGMRSVTDLEATIALDAVEVPEGLWDAIRAVPLDPSTWQDPR